MKKMLLITALTFFGSEINALDSSLWHKASLGLGLTGAIWGLTTMNDYWSRQEDIQWDSDMLLGFSLGFKNIQKSPEEERASEFKKHHQKLIERIPNFRVLTQRRSCTPNKLEQKINEADSFEKMDLLLSHDLNSTLSLCTKENEGNKSLHLLETAAFFGLSGLCLWGSWASKK